MIHIEMERGVVTLKSTNRLEAHQLLDIALRYVGAEEQPVTEAKKRKPYVHKQTCGTCGKVCRGKQGLGGHIRWMHPKEGVVERPRRTYTKSRAWFESRARRRELKALAQVNAEVRQLPVTSL